MPTLKKTTKKVSPKTESLKSFQQKGFKKPAGFKNPLNK